MYLTRRETALVSDIFTVVADSLPERLMRQEVGLRMLDLLRASHFGSYVWNDARKEFSNRVSFNISDDNLLGYERYVQYRDTVTPRLQKYRHAIRVSDAIPQAELVRTELFNDFLKRDGLYWGITMFAWSENVNIGDLRIWRSEKHDNFSDRDLAIAELIRPAFVTALSRARAEAGLTMPKIPAVSALSLNILRGLTARERQVVGLVLDGLLDKQIADRLGISYTTVRTHIGRSFQKLGVANRSRLIGLVKDSYP
jgi:DNA-binding CsgD family transcriptional regulator